jgi:hypothetical protein
MSNDENQVPIFAQHTVSPGETLSDIAYQYYGSGTREWWGPIYETNRATIGDNASLIRPGIVLDIPQLRLPQPEGRIIAEHTVRPNETLSHLALWYYGSAVRDLWMLIYEANQETIGDDPHLIRPDQILKIPDVTDHAWRMKSDRPMRLTFKNETNLRLGIYWLDYDGKEVRRSSIGPNENSQHSTYVTHSWVVRDDDSGREILSTIATRQRDTIEITEDSITSGPEQKPFPLVITNYTPFSVHLVHVAATGSETQHQTLRPGEVVTQQTFVNAVWRAREVNSGEPVGLFIVSEDPRREYAVSVSEFEGHPSATAVFRNESLLTLDIYWLYRGQEHLRQTLHPQAHVYQSTFESHNWVLRDARSGKEVRRIRAGLGTTEYEIHNGDLRAQGRRKQVSSLQIQNLSEMVVDVYQVNSLGARTSLLDSLYPGALIGYPPAETIDADDDPRPEPVLIYGGDVLCLVERSTQKEAAYFILSDEDTQNIDFGPRSYQNAELSTVEFINDTRLVLDVSWIDYAGQETTMRRIVPGERATYPTNVGSYWLLREQDSRQIVDLIFTETRSQSLRVEAANLRGLDQRLPATVNINNGTGLYLEISVTDEVGARHPVYDDNQQRLLLGPDDTFALVTHATQVVNFIEPLANVLIDQMIIPKRDIVDYAISTNSYDLPGRTRMTFRNETGMKINLFRESAEPETVLPFSARTFEDVPVSTFWLAADSLSNQVVGYAIASDQEQVIHINSDGLRSRESDDPVNVTFENNTAFEIDIYWINYYSADELQGTVAPGETFVVDTFTMHVFRFVEHKTGQEIDIYIPEASVADTHFVIEDMLVLREERPDGELWPGEVALFSGENFTGKVWILRNSFGDFSEISGLLDNARSLKVGPQTGVTLYSEGDYTGAAEDFYVETPTLLGTDLLLDSGPRISAIQVYRIVRTSDTNLRTKSGLRKNYRLGPDGSMQEYNSYRSVMNFPPEVQVVDVWATDPVTIEVDGQNHAVDNATSARLKTNHLNKMVINIEATEIGAPVLKLRTNMMEYVERVLVFPDAEVHQKFAGMEEGAIWRDRDKLGVDTAMGKAKVDALERAISNLSSAVAYVDKPQEATEEQQVTGDGMEYRNWMAEFGGANRARPAAFRSLSRQEARDLTANAEWIGPAHAQGILDDIGEFFTDAGEAIYGSVIEPIKEGVIDPIIDGVDDLIELAWEFGEEAVRIVKELGEQGYELVKKLGEEGLRAIGQLGQRAFDALVNLGTSAINTLIGALEEVGKTAFEALVNLGQAGIDLLETIGKHGLEALETIGTGALNLLMSATGSVGKALAKLGEDLIAGIGKAVVVTLEFAGKAVKFVLNTAKQVGEFVGKVWESIKVAFDKLLDWLDAFFNWGDYLDTHDAVLDIINTGLVSVGSMAQQAKPIMLDMIDSLAEQSSGAFDSFSDLIGAEQLPRGSTSEPNQPDGMDELDWLLSTIFGGGEGGLDDLGLSISGDEALIADAFASIESAIENDSPDLLGELERVADYLREAITDLERAPALLAGLLIDILRSVSNAAFSVLKTVMGAFLDLVTTMMTGLREVVNAPLNIPIVSEFYALITGGRTLTLGSLTSLVLAIPLTLFSKLFYNRKPFASGAAFAQENQVLTIGSAVDWGLTLLALRLVQGGTESAEIATYNVGPGQILSRINALLTCAALVCKMQIYMIRQELPEGGTFGDLLDLDIQMDDDWEFKARYWERAFLVSVVATAGVPLAVKGLLAIAASRGDWDFEKRAKWTKLPNTLKMLGGLASFAVTIKWAVEEGKMIETVQNQWVNASDERLLARGIEKYEKFDYYVREDTNLPPKHDDEGRYSDAVIINGERNHYLNINDYGSAEMVTMLIARLTGELPHIASFGKLTFNPNVRLVAVIMCAAGYVTNGVFYLRYVVDHVPEPALTA